jgi:hypothetical protein
MACAERESAECDCERAGSRESVCSESVRARSDGSTCSTSANRASISVGVRCLGSFFRMAMTASGTRMPAAVDAMRKGEAGARGAEARRDKCGMARKPNGKSTAWLPWPGRRRCFCSVLNSSQSAGIRIDCCEPAYSVKRPPLRCAPHPAEDMLARVCRPQLALAAHLNLLRCGARFASRDAKPRRSPSRSGMSVYTPTDSQCELRTLRSPRP